MKSAMNGKLSGKNLKRLKLEQERLGRQRVAWPLAPALGDDASRAGRAATSRAR